MNSAGCEAFRCRHRLQASVDTCYSLLEIQSTCLQSCHLLVIQDTVSASVSAIGTMTSAGGQTGRVLGVARRVAQMVRDLVSVAGP